MRRNLILLNIVCLLIILGSLIYQVNASSQLEAQDLEVEGEWCILLTTCVKRANATPEQTQEILNIYRRAIDKWLETDLPIIIVDSSDYDFKEYSGRLNICHFMCEETGSSSMAEAESILYAMKNSDAKYYKNVVKITGRYYIEDFENILANLDDADIYVQHLKDDKIKWQNSEIFGFKSVLAEDIFQPVIDKSMHMEKRLWEVSQMTSTTTFPPMPNILKVKRGGDKMVVDPL
jgi:hypothetical protein